VIVDDDLPDTRRSELRAAGARLLIAGEDERGLAGRRL